MEKQSSYLFLATVYDVALPIYFNSAVAVSGRAIDHHHRNEHCSITI